MASEPSTPTPRNSAGKKRDTIASLRSSLRRSDFLLNLTKRVATIQRLDDLLVTLIEIISSEMNAERGTLFLNDTATNELYSRVAQGTFNREIRLLNNVGIAGSVFQSGKGEIVSDTYADPRFSREVDESTGFVTRSILAAPVITAGGEIIGVVEALNKRSGSFTQRRSGSAGGHRHAGFRGVAKLAIRRADDEDAEAGNGIPGSCRGHHQFVGSLRIAPPCHGRSCPYVESGPFLPFPQ